MSRDNAAFTSHMSHYRLDVQPARRGALELVERKRKARLLTRSSDQQRHYAGGGLVSVSGIGHRDESRGSPPPSPTGPSDQTHQVRVVATRQPRHRT